MRATQGRTVRVDNKSFMAPFTPDHPEWQDHAVHGTYRQHLPSNAQRGLLRGGLEGVERDIHLSLRVEPQNGRKGVRDGSDSIVRIDLRRVHEATLPIFISAQGALLVTESIPAEYILDISDRRTGESLEVQHRPQIPRNSEYLG